MSEKVRLRAISTIKRVTAHLHTTNERSALASTRRYRGLMEKWSDERVVEHRRRRNVTSKLFYRQRQAELELLKQRNADEAERIIVEQRRQRNERRRFVRAQRKLPTWRQACSLLDRLEKQFAMPKLQQQQTKDSNKNALKYGTLRSPFVRVLLDQLKLRPGQRFVDAGSGIGLLCLLVALTTGVDVYGIEIREELHKIALKIGEEVRKQCVTKGWVGVGSWTFICGDARKVLHQTNIRNNNDNDDDDLHALIELADVLFMNNWAFDDLLSGDLLTSYAQHAPIDGRAVIIRNPTPRHRPSERGALRPLDLYLLPSRDDQVFDVPANGVDWRADSGVHWTVLSVLPLGVTQASLQSNVASKFLHMSRSIAL